METERTPGRAQRSASALGGEVGPPLQRLRAVVLLGGAVRPSLFSQAIGRPAVMLPLGENFGILDLWRAQVRRLTTLTNGSRLAVRVVSNDSRVTKANGEADGDLELRFEADPQEYRGTGGVLADLVKEYDDEDWILVSSAAQVLLEPLDDLALELAEAAEGDSSSGRASVVFFGSEDGSSSSLFLIRCGALRLISSVGFVDLKEQAIPRIAARMPVRAVVRPRATAHPVRTFEDYTRAIRLDYREFASVREESGPFAERWKTVASVVEEGGIVDASARVHDSVVLAGGTVEAGAILVRSVVCSGARVAARTVVVDTLVR